jgi:enamine deaminase RidA (YjgF/YER057c/UK114 family)
VREVRREVVAVRGVYKPTGGLYGDGRGSHATKVGNLVFVAGQVAKDTDGNLVGKGEIEAQAVQTYENLKLVLASVGASLDDLVKTTTYTTHLAYRNSIAEVRVRYFKTYFPPNTFGVVSSMATPDLLLEIEAIAALP